MGVGVLLMDKTVYPIQGIVPISILKDMSKVGRRQMDCRRSHGFIIKLRGATEYWCGEKTWLLEAGQVLYVSQGASYFIREVDPGYSYVINFSCAEHPEVPIEQLRFPQGFDVMPLAEKIYNGWQKQNGAYSALSNLYALLAKTVFSQEFYVSTREKQLLTPVLTYLEANLCDPELPIGQLNTLAGVSDVYLRRLFKKQFDAAPTAFVIRERMNLAKELLENEDLSITEVALQTGYRDPLYFSRLFKKQTGLTPSEYRKQHMDDLF